MLTSLNLMAVGPTATLAEELQKKLASNGVVCPPSSTLPLTTAVDNLARAAAPPHILFYQCNGNAGNDQHAIEQLRLLTNCEIAAVTNVQEPRDLLAFIRAGATDCLCDAEDFGNDLATLVARVGKSAKSGQDGRVVSLVSVSGGCGSSTLAVNLASTWAQSCTRSALVELAFNGGDCAAMLDIRPHHTVADLCLPVIDLDAEMLEKSMTEHPCGVHLLAGQPLWEHQHPLTPESCSHIVRLAASLFPYVVLDLQDVFHCEQYAALQESDLVLFVLRLELPCLIRTRQVIEYLEGRGFPLARIRLVANRQFNKSVFKPAQVVQALGRMIDFYIPDDYSTSAMCNNVGNPIVVEMPTTRLAVGLRTMADSLFKGDTVTA